MKKIISISLVAAMLLGLIALTGCGAKETKLKMAWYFPAAHSYGDEVSQYAKQFATDTDMEVKIMIGSDWEQATQDSNIRALVADGYNAIASFPASDGVSGLYEELGKNKVNVIGFGGSTSGETELFCVATDVEAAAKLACQSVIDGMGGKGGILNVLEVLTDTNTLKRKAGVEAAIAENPDVKLIQEVADINSIDVGVEKISSALTANSDTITGIVCTGNQSSSAAVQVLDDYYERNPDAAPIVLVCIDTPDDVMKGIGEGIVYGTIAQNTFAHGYLPLQMLKLMSEGYKKVDGTFFIDSGCVLVTKDNQETFQSDLQTVTDQLTKDLTVKYLKK